MIDIPKIPNINKIRNDEIEVDKEYQNMKVLHYQKSIYIQDNYNRGLYEFQQNTEKYNIIKGILSRKGASTDYRIVAYIHPTVRQFIEIVKYDPSNPPIDDYEAQGMKLAHDQTQSDFKGQKKANMIDFRNYILEGIRGDRTIYLPTITGWQSENCFEDTIFVALDESNPNAMYGIFYLPKNPIMQADGQTQTAAIFQAAKTAESLKSGALDNLLVTLEIQLNVSELQAAQSFADRNGRGSKKNKNLVIKMDSSSSLSKLREKAIMGTVFEGRLADGRSTGTTTTATKNIVDLSTMEQMILCAISNGKIKTEQFKFMYINHFLPYLREFFEMLDELFGEYWLERTPSNRDPFRKIYVHGWPFALKAIAKAYYHSRYTELYPLATAIGKEEYDPLTTEEEQYLTRVEIEKKKMKNQHQKINFDELKHRLKEINWYRYKKHWIELTGYSIKDGKKKTFIEKESGEERVVAKAQNTSGVIESVTSKLLSDNWIELCSEENESID